MKIAPPLEQSHAGRRPQTVRAGTVDSLPFGTATVHVREGAKPGPASGSILITDAEIDAARKGRTVRKRRRFTGAQELKG